MLLTANVQSGRRNFGYPPWWDRNLKKPPQNIGNLALQEAKQELNGFLLIQGCYLLINNKPAIGKHYFIRLTTPLHGN